MSTTSSTDTVRVIDGRSVPAAGKWNLDPSHSSVGFTVRHLMVSKVRGGFTDYSTDIEIGERPEDSRVDVTIQTASITTGDEQRDGHLTSPDFLDVAGYPTMTFRTLSVEPTSEDEWDVHGELTVRDVTRPVTLAVEFAGVSQDPWGNMRAGFSASTELDREDFGLTWNQALESGGVLVGKKVKIEIEVEAIQA
ncbi:MAG: polyisoprenoid-binding protein [Microthrixaceae bacterium]|nr:polyisoprenoid-binding protein [Microthrixaceae bacterium]